MASRKIGEDKIRDAFEKAVAGIPSLTSDEELLLARKAREGDEEAKFQLAEHNLKIALIIVRDTVQKKGNVYGQWEPSITRALVALGKAVEKFDPAHRVRFVNYAAFWIKKAIVETKPLDLPGWWKYSAQLPLQVIRSAPDDESFDMYCNWGIEDYPAEIIEIASRKEFAGKIHIGKENMGRLLKHPNREVRQKALLFLGEEGRDLQRMPREGTQDRTT